MSSSHKNEVESGRRFAFGKNWSRFLQLLDDDRVRQAETSLRDMFERPDLRGLTFVDIGSGSGLFPLAAPRLGARVQSIDFDPDSARCTQRLKEEAGADDEEWSIQEGSILDADLLARLPRFDLVYSWGVLHHTGDLWRAMQNTVALVRPGGKLFIAIYNDQGKQSDRWRRVKKLYCSGVVGRILVLSLFIPGFALRLLLLDLVKLRNPVARYRAYRRKRGMSLYHDWIDWLGGYPFEVARPEDVLEFCRQRGFTLERLKTAGGTPGNNQFVFRRWSQPPSGPGEKAPSD